VAHARNRKLGAGATAVVIGAGVGGAATALSLQRLGLDVTLVDQWEPGHARAASAGEHRILRSSHGTDELYARWSREARLRWLELGGEVGQELFVQNGCVLLAHAREDSWESASQRTLAALGIPHFRVGPDELRVRLPIVDPQGVAWALWEPEAGFVYARRALQALVSRFVAEGGSLRRGRASTDADERPLIDGRRVEADVVVMACGAWMGRLFPLSLGRSIRVVRQDVITVAPPAGSTAYDAPNMPTWIDHHYPAYGIPAAGGYGFKAVIRWTDLTIDVDADDRTIHASSIARTRRYLTHRFPALASAPVVGQEIGQIANTADTHFLIDRHPQHPWLVLVAGDSGHLFKHGPVAGDYIAEIAVGRSTADARFGLGDRSGGSTATRPQ
jgi:glycine/D-amino acid oxidase-like deaminating enzyme